MWAPTMTPPRSRWSRSAAGGRPGARPPTRVPGGFWSPRMRAALTATAPGPGNPNSPRPPPRPRSGPPAPTSRPAPPRATPTTPRSPPLTALTVPQRAALTAQLTVARHAQREAAPHQRRGAARQAAAGTGRKAVLTLEDRITITLLAQRFTLPGPVLATLFQVSTTTINNVIRQTQPLLTITGHHTEPAGLQLSSLTQFAQYAADAGIPVPEEIKSACR